MLFVGIDWDEVGLDADCLVANTELKCCIPGRAHCHPSGARPIETDIRHPRARMGEPVVQSTYKKNLITVHPSPD